MEKRPFSELGLSPEILKAVDKMGFEEASPIQTAVIPHALSGRDVVGQSATGSGKTAAFAIPTIEKVDASKRGVQALVLCPTRELAVQVAEEVGKLGSFKKGLLELPIYGGQSYERQYRGLAAGAQIVIGTPGRVMDHMERGSLKLDGLRVVVLDEADRMLDMGFRDDIERILSAVPETRQLLFFSATMPRLIQDMIKRYSRDPAWVRIEAHAANAPQVEQVFYEVDRRSKGEALTRLIDLHDFRYGIIFCSTKVMVDELDEQLHSRGYAVDRLHGDLSQMQRDRVMDKFRRRGFEFLIATDVAARGLDVDDLEVVFNYDLPNDAEDYTHRIGRTGRAGKSGVAMTFVCGREIYKLQSMAHYARLKIARGRIPSLDEVEEAKQEAFVDKLRRVLDAKQFRSHDRIVDALLEQGYASTDIASALIHLLKGGTVDAEPEADDAERAEPRAPRPANTAGPEAETSAKPVKAVKPPPAWVAAAKGEKQPKAKDIGAGSDAAANPSAHAELPRPEAEGYPEASQPKAIQEKPVQEKPTTGPERDPRSTEKPKKRGYERKPRTGREPGYTTVSFNIGAQHEVTPADIVGKIAGVTRLPATVVGAIDIHEAHSHIDVAAEVAETVVKRLEGIRLKNVVLHPTVVTPEG